MCSDANGISFCQYHLRPSYSHAPQQLLRGWMFRAPLEFGYTCLQIHCVLWSFYKFHILYFLYEDCIRLYQYVKYFMFKDSNLLLNLHEALLASNADSFKTQLPKKYWRFWYIRLVEINDHRIHEFELNTSNMYDDLTDRQSWQCEGPVDCGVRFGADGDSMQGLCDSRTRHAVRPVSTTVKWSASRAARALFLTYKLTPLLKFFS